MPVGRPERAQAATAKRDPVAKGSATDKVAWNKAVVLVNVALIAVIAVAGFNYSQRDQEPERALELPQPTTATTSGVVEDQGAVSSPTPAPADSSAPALVVTPPAGSPEVAAPRVKTIMRSNFARGDGWPTGAGFRESGKLAWPLGVVDGLMTHGRAEGPHAVSWLEKWTKSDVRLIGARVLFAPNQSGAVALTAWHDSVLEGSGAETPRSGMRLVAEPGRWRLVVLDGQGETTLAEGTYEQRGRAATFVLTRRASTLWVTDPRGSVVSVTDPRVAALSGPWASWELAESGPTKRPAGLQEVWAG